MAKNKKYPATAAATKTTKTMEIQTTAGYIRVQLAALGRTKLYSWIPVNNLIVQDTEDYDGQTSVLIPGLPEEVTFIGVNHSADEVIKAIQTAKRLEYEMQHLTSLKSTNNGSKSGDFKK